MGFGVNEALGPRGVVLNHVALLAVGRITPYPRLAPLREVQLQAERALVCAQTPHRAAVYAVTEGTRADRRAGGTS